MGVAAISVKGQPLQRRHRAWVNSAKSAVGAGSFTLADGKKEAFWLKW